MQENSGLSLPANNSKTLLQEGPYKLWLVKDAQQYDEPFLLAEFISPQLKRFQKPLETLVELDHPQLQQIKKFSYDANKLYIFQSYVEGRSYQELLEAGYRWTEYEVVRLMNQVLSVLSYLHKQKINHGNISPGNLILRKEDNLPVLTNFQLIDEISRAASFQPENQPQDRELTNSTISEDKRVSASLQSEPPPLSWSQFNPAQDLYDLAVTAILLLTGVDREKLFDSKTKIGNWEDWKVISDRRIQVLKQMLAKESDSAYAVLQSLNTVFPEDEREEKLSGAVLLYPALIIGAVFATVATANFVDNPPKTPTTPNYNNVTTPSTPSQPTKTPSSVLVSKDGNLTITRLRSYQEGCATGKPSYSYTVKDGVTGLLYPSQCGGYGSDVAEFNFFDTSGAERCKGNALLTYTSARISSRANEVSVYWKIQDAVTGYRCSTIGESYKTQMR